MTGRFARRSASAAAASSSSAGGCARKRTVRGSNSSAGYSQAMVCTSCGIARVTGPQRAGSVSTWIVRGSARRGAGCRSRSRSRRGSPLAVEAPGRVRATRKRRRAGRAPEADSHAPWPPRSPDSSRPARWKSSRPSCASASAPWRMRWRRAPFPARCARATWGAPRDVGRAPRPGPRRSRGRRWRTRPRRGALDPEAFPPAGRRGTAPPRRRQSAGSCSCRCLLAAGARRAPLADEGFEAGPRPGDELGVADATREPVAARLVPDGATDGEPAAGAGGGSFAETGDELLDGRVEAQDENASAPGIPPREQVVHLAPALAAHRGELPPLRVDTGLVDTIQRAGNGPVVAGNVRGRDHFQEQLVAAGLDRVVQGTQLRLLLRAEIGRLVGVVAHQALHDLLARPAREAAPDGAATFELERS